MKLKTLIISTIAAISLAISLNAAAVSDSHYAAAKELMKTMEMGKLLNESIDQMLDLQLQQNPGLQPYRKVFKEFLSKYMSEEAIVEDLVVVYTEIFTEAELKDIAAFYQTPTGKKTLKYQVELYQRGAEIGQQKVQEHLPELEEMIREETARIEALQSQDSGE